MQAPTATTVTPAPGKSWLRKNYGVIIGVGVGLVVLGVVVTFIIMKAKKKRKQAKEDQNLPPEPIRPFSHQHRPAVPPARQCKIAGRPDNNAGANSTRRPAFPSGMPGPGGVMRPVSTRHPKPTSSRPSNSNQVGAGQYPATVDPTPMPPANNGRAQAASGGAAPPMRKAELQVAPSGHASQGTARANTNDPHFMPL